MQPIEARQLIERGYREVLPGKFASGPATVMLLAIGLQESRFRERVQLVGRPPRPVGPARGFWQFERGGGVTGVLSHPATKFYARGVCAMRGIAAEARAVHDALGSDDLLGVAFARLLLFSDPRSLPAPGDVEAAWNYYLRNWRPGKPHRATWDGLYRQSLEAMA